ncbi:MAG: 3-carboxy-cis,cis-muconate cycloisomerase [Propionibacteriales bacterium]|nr:3-carboxy-cis,cis-muconate cycloisomerase [Propionibacteriales bacterium]
MLDALDGDPVVDQAVDDAALVRAMLDVEAALARAAARAGLITAEAAEAVSRVADTLKVDPDGLGRRASGTASPVIPLVRDLVDAVPDAARGAVHAGSTTQDVLDTALQLLAHRALVPVIIHLTDAAHAAAELAAAYRDTLATARTLGQPAVPTTFGLRAAGWLAGLDTARAELSRIRRTLLAVQIGGAGGTQAGYGAAGPRVAAYIADELGLVDPGLPWHTERSRIHALAAGLGSATAACGKVATDVVLMSQHEVGEVAEGDPGGSSAMPHKQNPSRSVLVVAGARRTPGLVATAFASGMHEQERATGSWQAEWATLRELLRLTGGAAARVATVLSGLRVDPGAMRRNLDGAGPGLLSEALVGRLAPLLGRTAAHEAVQRALAAAPEGGAALAKALRAEPAVAAAYPEQELLHFLDPSGHTGAAGALVDQALARHAQESE